MDSLDVYFRPLSPSHPLINQLPSKYNLNHLVDSYSLREICPCCPQPKRGSKLPQLTIRQRQATRLLSHLRVEYFHIFLKKKIGVASTSMKWDKFWEINLNYKPGFEHTKDAYYINESCEKNHQNFRGQFFIYHFFESILWSPFFALKTFQTFLRGMPCSPRDLSYGSNKPFIPSCFVCDIINYDIQTKPG